MKSSTGFLSPIRREDLENVNTSTVKAPILSGTYHNIERNQAQLDDQTLRKTTDS